MQRKKEKTKKSWLVIIGFFSIFLGLSLITYHFISNKQITDMEDDAIKQFYIHEEEIIDTDDSTNNLIEEKEVKEQNKIEYIAVLKIPKINLVRGLVDPHSYLNDINYNVQILKNSSMPDQENGNLILASHSGNARISYFRNLDKLSLGDMVSIDYKGKTYNYKIVNIYDIEKTGTAKIIRDTNETTLTLITCRHNTQKQIVVIAILQN